MRRYIASRILQAVITSLILVTIVFVLVRLSGDPMTWLANPRMPESARADIRVRYGLDKPIIVQYGHFLVGIVKGDFGTSFQYGRPALRVVAERIPATLELVGTAMLISLLVAVPVGVYSAVRRGRFLDVAGRIFAFLGMSAPNFWLGLMGMYIFGVKLNILPVGGRDHGIRSLILPAMIIAWILAAGIARLTRSGMLDVLSSDYITMAKAKGVPARRVIWKHAFKNASIPVVTMVSLLMIIVLSGDVVVENVFSWPGMGRVIMTATLQRDFPVVQAATVLISFMFIIIGLVADITYAYLNPRIRYGKA